MRIDTERIKRRLPTTVIGIIELALYFAELPIEIAGFVYRRILRDREPAYIAYFAFELAVVGYFSTLHNLIGWEMSKTMIWFGLSYIFFTFTSIDVESRVESHMTEMPTMLTQAIYFIGTFLILSHNL